MVRKEVNKLRILGFFVGLLSTLFGISGGIILVPLLLLHFYYSKQEAVSTSLLMIIPISFFSATLYFFQNTFPIPFLLIFFIILGLILGTKIGIKLLTHINKSTLLIFFSIFLLLLSLKMVGFFSVESQIILPIYTSILLGLLVGILAIILGIGGGVLFVPLLNAFYGLPLEQSILTSLIIIPISSVIALNSLKFKFYTREFKRKQFFRNLTQIILFALFGALWGNFFSLIINENITSILFGFFLFFYAFYLLYQTFFIYYVQRGLHIKMYNNIKARIKYGENRHIIKSGKKVRF